MLPRVRALKKSSRSCAGNHTLGGIPALAQQVDKPPHGRGCSLIPFFQSCAQVIEPGFAIRCLKEPVVGASARTYRAVDAAAAAPGQGGFLGLAEVSLLLRPGQTAGKPQRHKRSRGDSTAPLVEILYNQEETGYRGMLSLELFNDSYCAQDPVVFAAAMARTRGECDLTCWVPAWPGWGRRL